MKQTSERKLLRYAAHWSAAFRLRYGSSSLKIDAAAKTTVELALEILHLVLELRNLLLERCYLSIDLPDG